MVAQAPSAKRALERFVHEMHSLFLRAGEPPEAITVGFLKHRDIDGNAMPSQVRQHPVCLLAACCLLAQQAGVEWSTPAMMPQA